MGVLNLLSHLGKNNLIFYGIGDQKFSETICNYLAMLSQFLLPY